MYDAGWWRSTSARTAGRTKNKSPTCGNTSATAPVRKQIRRTPHGRDVTTQPRAVTRSARSFGLSSRPNSKQQVQPSPSAPPHISLDPAVPDLPLKALDVLASAALCMPCPAEAAQQVLPPPRWLWDLPRHCLTELISRVTPCSCSLPEQPRASPRSRAHHRREVLVPSLMMPWDRHCIWPHPCLVGWPFRPWHTTPCSWTSYTGSQNRDLSVYNRVGRRTYLLCRVRVPVTTAARVPRKGAPGDVQLDEMRALGLSLEGFRNRGARSGRSVEVNYTGVLVVFCFGGADSSRAA